MPLRSKIRYSFLRIFRGSDLSRRRLPYMAVTAEKPGPVVWLTACAHGDEVGGMVVVQEVFRAVASAPLLCGEMHAFPLMNPFGFEMGARHVAISQEDLNRAFPGRDDGALAERIAEKIFSTIVATVPRLVIDLHNDWTRSIPYVVLDAYFEDAAGGAAGEATRRNFDASLAFARRLSLPVVIETETSHRSLSGSLLRAGVPAVTLELGESNIVNERMVDQGVKSVLNVLRSLEMLGDVSPGPPANLPSAPLRYSHTPFASSSGILRFLVRPGDVVRPRQAVAKVFNVFGRLQETLHADAHAVVLGHSDSAVAYPGAEVLAFGVMG